MSEGESSLSRSRFALPESVRVFKWLCVGLTALSAVFVLWMVRAHPLPPHGLPPLVHNDWYSDLLTSLRLMPVVHEPAFFDPQFGWIYPAPCIFIYQALLMPGILLRHFTTGAILMYWGAICVGLGVIASGLLASLSKEGVRRADAVGLLATTILLSWPLWFCIHQGNIEVFLFFGMALGVWLMYTGRWLWAAVAIGMVAALKLYPILLLGILLSQRKYKAIALSVAVFVATNLLSMEYIGPSVAAVWAQLAPGLASFKQLGFYPGYFGRDYLCFDHALVGLIRVLTSDNARLLTFLAKVWVPAFAVFGMLEFFLHVRRQPVLNQLLFLVLAMVLLPPKSYDYTLLVLYLPWFPLVLLAIRSRARGVRIPGLNAILWVMAVPLSATVFLQVHGVYFFGQVTCVALLAMVVLSWKYPMRLGAEPEES